MKTVKCFIFRNSPQDSEVTIFVEDGGAANTYISGDSEEDSYLRLELHQDRITKDSKFETFWEDLCEGKMYTKDFDGEGDHVLKRDIDDEAIDEAIYWLYASTRKVKFQKIEMGNFTKRKFNEMKKQCTFE